MRFSGILSGAYRRGRRLAAGAAAVIVLLIAVDVLVDEPLRRNMERAINERLRGSTTTIDRLDFHVLGFSLDLHDLVLTQREHPDPPVARFPTLQASVQWRQLLFGRLVANVRLEEPIVHVNRAHLQKEARDETPVEKRGWQEAVQAIHPLQVNELRIDRGAFTYADDTRFRPLEIREINGVARNIRNVRSAEGEYPSPLHLAAVVFDRGRLELDGHADFLRVPHAGVNADVRLDDIVLDYFAPLIQRYNFAVKGGVLSLAGRVEYAPEVKIVDLADVSGREMTLDYVHSAPEAAQKTKQVAKEAARSAEKVSNDPGVLLRVARLTVTESAFGFVNRARDPNYRVVLADTRLDVRNLTNHLSEGTATARVRGKFMGAGETLATATFRPETKGPDFDLNVRIENTQMPAMNDLLRAYGKFDVVSGLFSFYSELRVKNGRVDGYVKPLFQNLDVYDERQDREKNVFRKIYEGLVGGVSKLLENVPRDEVATKTEIAGPVEDPRANTLQVVIRLVQNAFFKAILPGFERELGPPGRRR